MTRPGRCHCEPGSAAFFIERIGRIDDRAIEWRQTVIRGDRFTVSTSYPEPRARLTAALPRAPAPSDRRWRPWHPRLLCPTGHLLTGPALASERPPELIHERDSQTHQMYVH